MPRRKRRVAGAKKVGPRGRRAARPAGGANQAVRSLLSYRGELLAQRAHFDAQIAAVDQALQVMGTKPAAGTLGRRGRAKGGGPREGSLKDFICRVLKSGGVMSVKDITEGVLKAGYQTKNRTLAKSVGIALTEMPSAQKVARGKFRLK